MGIKVSEGSGSGNFEKAPEGTHIARCVQVIDLGTQYSEHYGKSAHKMLFGFELLNEADSEGKPFMVFMRRTASLHKRASLRSDLESWRAKPFTEEELKSFDLSKVLGAPAYISVVQSSDGKWMNISSIMAPPKGSEIPKAKSELVLFDLDDVDMNIFNSFGEKLQETIRKSEEWSDPASVPESDDDPAPKFDEDEIPF